MVERAYTLFVSVIFLEDEQVNPVWCIEHAESFMLGKSNLANRTFKRLQSRSFEVQSARERGNRKVYLDNGRDGRGGWWRRGKNRVVVYEHFFSLSPLYSMPSQLFPPRFASYVCVPGDCTLETLVTVKKLFTSREWLETRRRRG